MLSIPPPILLAIVVLTLVGGMGAVRWVRSRHHRHMRRIGAEHGFHFCFLDRFELAQRAKSHPAFHAAAVGPVAFDLFYATRHGVRHYVFTLRLGQSLTGGEKLVHATEPAHRAEDDTPPPLTIRHVEPLSRPLASYHRLLQNVAVAAKRSDVDTVTARDPA